MSLLALWPSTEAVDECILPEAEGAHDAVLLAVHQPAPLTYRLTNGDRTAYPTNEEELFDYFIRQSVPTGAHVVPITGASGVGKSHLIRLLAAKLKVCPDAHKYVVVRIPKSASLRKVVELILALLPSEQYAGVKTAFERALADVDLASATVRFQAALDISLQERAKELREQLKQGSASQALKEQLHHAQRLPLLLSDATTVEYFRSRILPRIVQRAVAGRDVHLDEQADQFTAQDLDLSGIDLTQAASQVSLYYRTALEAKEGRGRKVAADVLNEVRDAATRQLFQLQDAIGGMTLQDVILEIRRLLLEQERELVILVEDFKALTGIQETLLNVLIQEGVRDGKQGYATMRSAIAVTDGYLRERDTIATRAHREWVVESRLQSDEDVLSRTKEIVAGYLNAARWGQAALIRRYLDQDATSVTPRVPLYTAEDAGGLEAQIEAFGTVHGVPLFPFTEGAIEYLARAALTQGDALVFRPRAIINSVLRDVLLHGREPFAAGAFPPASLKPKPSNAEIAQWLVSLALPEETRARYERFIMIYGAEPDHVTDIGRIPHGVFAAFKLPPPKITGSALQPAARQAPVATLSTPTPAHSDAALTRIGAFRQALDTWIQDGTLLEQANARDIRLAISTALKHRIDWNRERCRNVTIQPNQISIPNARGEANLAADAFSIAADSKDPDGRLRLALVALIRFYDGYKQRADYEEADEDLARIGNFIDELLPAALKVVRATVHKAAKTYTSLLATNSRILGIPERGRSVGAISSFLFAPSSAIEKMTEDSPVSFQQWSGLQANAVALRPKLTQLLLDAAGCFQGKGHTPDGIDITRIAEVVVASDTPESAADASVPVDLKQELGAMTEQRVQVRARQVIDEAKRFRAEVHSALGTDVDKNAVCNAMKELAQELKDHGNWASTDIGLSFPEFIAVCEAFRTTALKESLNHLDRVPDVQETNSAMIVAVAQLSVTPLLTARRFITAAQSLIRSTQKVAATLESQFQGVNPSVLASQLSGTLETTLEQMAQITQATET